MWSISVLGEVLPSEPTDVLVKLVRLLANLSISRGVGREVHSST